MRVSFNNNDKLLILLLILQVFPAPGICGAADADVDFSRLYGSDVGMGMGARAAGMGGAFVSLADDGSAVFWNPAGLAAGGGLQLFIAGETPSEFSAAALIWSPGFAAAEALNLAVGVGHVRRLVFTGDSGAGNWSGYPSHLLDVAMIDVVPDFSGRIDSVTYDNRISLAFSPPWLRRLSVGLTYICLT
jgi:hypothetical protein